MQRNISRQFNTLSTGGEKKDKKLCLISGKFGVF